MVIGWHELTGTLHEMLVTPLDWRVAGGVIWLLLFLTVLVWRRRLQRVALLVLTLAVSSVVALQHHDSIPGMERVAGAVGWPQAPGWSEVPLLLDSFADRQAETIRAMRALEARSGTEAPAALPDAGADDNPVVAE